MSKDLPLDLFLIISSLTPIINVDLLIRNEKKQILLAWRNDVLLGNGWHIPGGIIRFKETFHQRIQKVVQLEIGVKSIKCSKRPISISQCFLKGDIRGHQISLLFDCFLPSTIKLGKMKIKKPTPGALKWHTSCPKDLLATQRFYQDFFTSAPVRRIDEEWWTHKTNTGRAPKEPLIIINPPDSVQRVFGSFPEQTRKKSRAKCRPGGDFFRDDLVD